MNWFKLDFMKVTANWKGNIGFSTILGHSWLRVLHGLLVFWKSVINTQFKVAATLYQLLFDLFRSKNYVTMVMKLHAFFKHTCKMVLNPQRVCLDTLKTSWEWFVSCSKNCSWRCINNICLTVKVDTLNLSQINKLIIAMVNIQPQPRHCCLELAVIQC